MEFKAGMESVDFNMINIMLDRFSHGTHFQEKIQRDEAKTQTFIDEALTKLRSMPDTDEYRGKVDKYIEKLKADRVLNRTFIHIDMDAFYAHVEEMDAPELRGKPVAVGSMDMLVTSNYVARKFGVRSGLPGLLAMNLCPHLTIKPTCSPLLAKLCSEVNKPNGFFMLDKDLTKSQEFLADTQIKKIPGIGKSRQKLLDTLGLSTVEDILDNSYELYYILSEHHVELLFKHALCIPILPKPSAYHLLKRKSMISKEKNCKELYDESDLDVLIESLYKDVVMMLCNENKIACGLIVKIQDFSFKTANHTFSLTKSAQAPQLDVDGQVVSPPVSPTMSPTKREPITFEENCQKIWTLFSKTAKSVPLSTIRCLGLKLVNLSNQ
eukprot:gene13240-15558_t